MSSRNTLDLAEIRFLHRQLASLLVYQSVLADEVGSSFLQLLQALYHSDGGEASALVCLQAYGNWFKNLAAINVSWQDYLINQIIVADNPFSQQAQIEKFASLPPALIAAAEHDLQALHSLYKCSSYQMSRWVQTMCNLSVTPVFWNQEPQESTHHELLIRTRLQQGNWADAVKDLASYYRQCGVGIFAKYFAFRWQAGQLVGIAYPDQVKPTDLFGYESQKAALVKNTEFLIAGYPALNVLLYGSRGSGKSSLVKGILNKYSDRHLRLIEVAKSHLQDLPTIVEQLRGLPQKFIIFVDDLSFEEDDDAFKSLKVVLEGNITARPQNVVVYATSNRRHLIREFFEDRPRPSDADEVNSWDTVQEKLSFSDRFGLTLTFEPADQNTYLNIIRHLAQQAHIQISQEDLAYRALQWATRHNGRSGRTARQFIDFLNAELKMPDSSV
ncbi:protein of unknown function DUF815 [Crinalium epipsammum PCC 9333]|uniref:AAA+ ATPase domain-containing protein n=1 Tax=Crinalium epipsammum PCC 9333 TaxID=1173022 RepID=K9W4L2_9CYAN|nr:ATP-binding protein [Crinalium epipsammum]AFZ14682.1 protein of unknown function DUF815 [Crinalium epipsammum PCC 9333]